MRLNRNQTVLIVLLVAQVLLSAVVLWPRGGAAGASEPLVPGLQDAEAVSMSITDGEGQSIQLSKVTGAWVYPAADDYPANGESITGMVDKLAALTTQRLVTRTDASHKRLQVASDDYLRKVEIETADGTRHTLYVGSSPSYGASHVRLEGRSETYLAGDISQWDLAVTPATWIDTTYLSVPQDELLQATLVNANGTFTLEKGEDDSFTLVGLQADEVLNTAEVSGVITKVTQVIMNRPLSRSALPEYGMDAPLAVATLWKGEEVITLTVGALDESDSTYVVKASTSPYYVRVSDYYIRPLVEDTRDSFIQPPPTPTPTAAATS